MLLALCMKCEICSEKLFRELLNMGAQQSMHIRQDLLYEVEGAYHVSQALWMKIRKVANSEKAYDAIDQLKETKEAVESVIPDFAEEVVKHAMETVMQKHVIDTIVEVGKVLPWVGQVVNLAAVIYMGVQDVYENKENFIKLNEFINSVLQTLGDAPTEQLEHFFKVNEEVSKPLSYKFGGYMAKGVKLVERFNQRSKMMAFVMRGRDDYEFQKIQQGLNSTLILIIFQMQMMKPPEEPLQVVHITATTTNNNNNNHDEQKIRKKIEELGNGDYKKGQEIFIEYLNKTDNSEKNKKIEEILELMPQTKKHEYDNSLYDKRQEIKKQMEQLGNGDLKKGMIQFNRNIQKGGGENVDNILKLMPYGASEYVVLPPKAATQITNLINDQLPHNLSPELKQFWIDNFGYVKKVKWGEFVDTVSEKCKEFLQSDEVVSAPLDLTKYILRYKLDKDEDQNITASELRALYEWCSQRWSEESNETRGPQPNTMLNVLKCLFHNMETVDEEIKKNQTLDLKDKGVVADQVEEEIFQKHEEKLAIYRVLILSRNPFGDVGGTTVFQNIKNSMRNLQRLEIDGCRLGDELRGIQSIISNLQYLNLADNQIGDKGITHIAKGFDSDADSVSKLTTLDLQNNKISDLGVEKLTVAIANGSTKLGELFLNGNDDITAESSDYIDILQDNNIEVFIDFFEEE